MEFIVNYPNDDDGKQILLENVSKKLVVDRINELNIKNYSKSTIIKRILEILKNGQKLN